MKFKKMEINGFKSFADKTEIKFGNGVTGIVGPNGCGKSNVADSIRFALGEQSSKTLRGGNMQDVIFNGTEKRKSQSFCEVSLYFDNSQRIFRDINYDEVVISRKLFRSNESEYYLNKTPCRRMDIIEALRDSGVGKEGYSIIGQGKIDELISSKPEDRRSIFDEAAGISKFKAKKIESEHRLARMRINLDTINTILEEKSKQLAPLTRQAQTARKYLELSDELKHYEINIYLHQYETTTDTKNEIMRNRDEIIASMEKCSNDRNIAEDGYNKAMTEFANIDKYIEDTHNEMLSLTEEIALANGEVSLRNNDIKHVSEKNIEAQSEIDKYKADILSAQKMIEEGETFLAKRSSELETQTLQDNEMTAKFDALVKKISEIEGEERAGHNALLDAINRLSEIKSNMSKLVTEKEGLEAQVAELDERLQRMTSSAELGKRSHEAMQIEYDKLCGLRDAEQKTLDANVMKYNENMSLLSLNNSRLSSLNAEYYSLSGRKELFEKFNNENAGFERSVSKLLDASKTDFNLSSRIEGVVAKIIRVSKNYETAIEMALGGAVQNIITKSEDEAEYLISYLKKNSFGRVTFLPMSVVRPRALHEDLLRYLNVKGCYGVASSLVEYESKFDGVVKNLLGTTVIVDNLNTGIGIARASRYSFKIVTLDGDVINPHGAITGGSKKADVANVFSYDRELREIIEKLSTMKDVVDALEKEHTKISNEQNALSLDNKARTDNVHALEVKITAQEERITKLLSDIQNYDAESRELTISRDEKLSRITKINDDLGSVNELERIIQEQKTDATSLNVVSAGELSSLKSARDALSDDIMNVKLSITRCGADIENTKKDILRLRDNIAFAENMISVNENAIIENTKLIESKREELNSLILGSNQQKSNRLAELNVIIADSSKAKEEIQNKIKRFESERDRLIDLFTELTDKRNVEDMKLQRVDIDLEQMQERISEVYKLTYDDCVPLRDLEFDINIGIEEASKLRRRIDSLGHVNIDAIVDCETVFNEYNELEKQRDDVANAERDLVKVISDLSRDMKTTFDEKFAQINENFKYIFKELFNGGTAELVLLEPSEGKDELSAGVEIKAQPPQKKLQLLSLLSGGEKAMTAIAILFAILQLRPMPFCVLDEIEAALDDANALRFAKYLKRYSGDTQFIVITHRKPTMELADALYGVTMEEKGVSKMVSVKLSDAVKLAQ